MSRFKGLLDRQQEPSDAESEREALLRQRQEGAVELAGLKTALAERVANVQLRERELELALARVEKREQALEGAARRGARVEAVRTRVAEAREARAARQDGKERDELERLRADLARRESELVAREAALLEPPVAAAAPILPTEPAPEKPDAHAAELHPREAELGTCEEALAEREALASTRAVEAQAAEAQAMSETAAELRQRAEELTALESALAIREEAAQVGAAELAERQAALAEREAAIEAREQEPEPAVEAEPAPDPGLPDADELAALEAKLQELGVAEQAFVKTRSELAARSDALAEQEADLVARERSLAARETPEQPGLEALEARIRRLEQGGRSKGEATQTFSAGLRALQKRGLRPTPDEPLH